LNLCPLNPLKELVPCQLARKQRPGRRTANVSGKAEGLRLKAETGMVREIFSLTLEFSIQPSAFVSRPDTAACNVAQLYVDNNWWPVQNP
jgi:hypothetical protein